MKSHLKDGQDLISTIKHSGLKTHTKKEQWRPGQEGRPKTAESTMSGGEAAGEEKVEIMGYNTR